MPGPLLHQGPLGVCAHGGQMSVISKNANVLVNKMPAATVSDAYPIIGCTFMTGSTPHPCVAARWLTPAMRVFINKQPAVLATSAAIGVAADLAAQGPAVVTSAQPKVVGQ
jgi:hypothetical protein